MNRAALTAVILLPLAAAQLPAQSFRTMAGSRLRRGETALNVRVEFAAGRFRVSRDETGVLYRSRIVYNEDRFHPVMDYARGDLTIGLKANRGRSQLSLNKLEAGRQVMDLGVAPGVPVSFELSIGAAEADVDFGGLDLTRATIKTGASQSLIAFSTPTTGQCDRLSIQVGAAELRAEQLGNARCRRLDFAGGVGDVTLDFSGEWGESETRADIAVGMGSLTLRLPRAVGVEVRMTRFLSSFNQSGFVKRGDSFYTPNWESAKTRLHLDVKAGLGSVDVVWQ
ncbi:MAG: hypothetical protein HY560_09735 [Gemmatimonadetes bacterium]|nr:hypothetical protein [Gemmatimonadota bacterium]